MSSRQLLHGSDEVADCIADKTGCDNPDNFFGTTFWTIILVLLAVVLLIAAASYFFGDKWGCVRDRTAAAAASARAGAEQAASKARAQAQGSSMAQAGGCCAEILDLFGAYNRQLTGCVGAGRGEQTLGPLWFRAQVLVVVLMMHKLRSLRG